MNSFTETELLSTVISLSNNATKYIATESGIKVNAFYKWKTTDVHLSPSKADALLLYFIENEPVVLIKASLVNTITDLLLDYSSSLTEEEVA